VNNKLAYTNSSLVTYKKISPSKTSPRNHVIDTITIHCMAGNLSIETCGNVFQTRQASSNYGIGTDGRIAMYVEEKDRSWATSNSANDNRAVTIEVANDGDASTGWHVSDKAMTSLINLVTDICKRNGISQLKWSTNKSERINHTNGCNMTVHRDYASKSCPGDYLYGKHSYIASEVNKRLKNNSTSTVSTSTSKTYTQAQFIKDVQSTLGLTSNGKATTTLLNKTVTLSTSTNSKHALVKLVQKYLNALGYSVGTVDGSFGAKTKAGIIKYQKAKKLEQDGVIGKNTWKKLLGLS
jgi:hypothetical protein